MDIEYNVELKDYRTAVLAGRIDMYDWKTKTVIDLKTTKYIRWQKQQGFIPKLEHILQVQCYYTMFSESLPIENLNIMYIDMSNIITYEIPKKDVSNWIRIRISEIENALRDNKTPIGEVSGLCKYCKYQTKCGNDGNGLKDKPMSIPKNIRR